jgi:hypothetical protein
VHLAAVAAPGGELPADVGHLPHRHGRAGEAGHRDLGYRPAHERNGQGEEVRAHLGQGHAPVGRDEDQPGGPGLRSLFQRARAGRAGRHGADPARQEDRLLVRVTHTGRRRPHDAQVLPDVGPVPPERDQPLRGAVRVDPRRVAGEVGHVAVRGGRDDGRLAALGRHPDEGGPQRAREEPGRLLQVARRGPGRYEALAIGRPGDVGVERRGAGELHRSRPAGRLRPHDVPAPRVVPGDPGQRASVRRPGRMVFPHLRRGDPSRRPVREVLHPEAPERRERHAAAVGRDDRVSDLLGRDRRGRVHPVVEPDLGPDVERHLRLERDPCRRRAVQRHAPDLAAIGRHDGAAVGRERVARQHVHRGPRFLLVPLHGPGQPALVARGQLADPEPGLGLVPGPVDQPLPVRGHPGPEGRSVPGGDRGVGAGLAVVHPEAVLGEDRVVRPVAGAAGVVHEAAVRRERRTERLQGRGLAHELEPAPALHRVEMDFVRAAQSAGAAHRDELSVGRPFGRHVQVPVPLGDLGRVLEVERQDPHVVAAAPVGDEGHLLPVRAEARLHVVPHAVGEPSGPAALDRQSVEIAQEIEHDRAPVGAHVERDPGPPGGGELRLALGLERQRPPGGLCPGRGGLLRGGGRTGAQSECDQSNDPLHGAPHRMPA